MFRRSISTIFIALLFVVVSSPGKADSESPEGFILTLSERLQVTLTEARNKKRLNDIAYIDQLIDQEILPHVALEALCRRIFQEHWKEITEKGKKQKAYDAVISSLKRTYRLALSSYNGQKIAVIDTKNQKAYSIVRIKIKTDGENDHTIDFAVRQFESVWKVFDFSVDGIVVSKTLNSSISRQVDTAGIDEMIKSLNPEKGS